MGVTLIQEKYEVIPMGQYVVQVNTVKVVNGTYGDQVTMDLLVVEGEHEGASLKCWTSAKFSNKSKLYKYTRALFEGKDIPEDYDLDLDHLLDKTAVAAVLVKRKDDGTEFNRVEALEPLGGWPEPVNENPNTQPLLSANEPF